MEDDREIQKYLSNVAYSGIRASAKLVFDTNTGKLLVVSNHDPKHDVGIFIDMMAEGFFGGSFVALPEKDKILITPQSYGKKEVSVSTMHISCQSDTYQQGHSYGGVIIYQYNDKSEWRTANNTHCKSGYIVIQDTDSEDVKKWMGKEPGVVHGAVYRNVFGESAREKEVVGEGFALRDGKFEMCSSVFNNPPGSEFHDHRRRMHELSEHCVRKIVEYWKTAGPCWVRQRNFEVKQLLENFNFGSLYMTM